jgi:hypothetical protein
MTTKTHGVREPSREAKRLAAVVLEVLTGARTPPQAAAALGISLPRYYQLEERGCRGLVDACEPRPRGRQRTAETQMQTLTKENERLQRDLARQQALVRLTQRTVGVPPPAPAKATGSKRPRKPRVRALRRAERLQQDAQTDVGTAAVPARESCD